MKYFTLSIFLLLSAFICNAQLAAPKQTDTLVISSVKYNYADINKENWPCEIIYKSTTDIRIGDQTFNIIKADKSGTYVIFVVYDVNDNVKKNYTLTFREEFNGKYTLTFSGYEFICHKKGTLKDKDQRHAEPNAMLAGRRVDGTLPKPGYEVEASGKVVVKIWVNQYGEVEKAQAGVEGTTATDKTLWQAAYKAAMVAHFNMDASAPALQEGTITYIFPTNRPQL